MRGGILALPAACAPPRPESMVRVQRKRSAMPGPKLGWCASIQALCRAPDFVALENAKNAPTMPKDRRV